MAYQFHCSVASLKEWDADEITTWIAWYQIREEQAEQARQEAENQ